MFVHVFINKSFQLIRINPIGGVFNEKTEAKKTVEFPTNPN